MANIAATASRLRPGLDAASQPCRSLRSPSRFWPMSALGPSQAQASNARQSAPAHATPRTHAAAQPTLAANFPDKGGYILPRMGEYRLTDRYRHPVSSGCRKALSGRAS